MRNNNIAISVIIPAYNEANRISGTIKDCSTYLMGHGITHEIVIVDDGSSDKTCEVVNNLKKELPNIELIKMEKNRGKGCAVKKGMINSSGVSKLFMDADGATNLSEIEKLLPHLKYYDVVIGSRSVPGSKIEKNQAWYRRLSGKTGNLLVRLLFGLHINDTQCGFKLFTYDASSAIFPALTLDRFGFDIELLAIAKFHNLKIKEVPIVWSHKDDSKVKIKDYFDVLISTFKVKIKMIFGLYK